MSPFARKRFGQHFLHDSAAIARILAAIDTRNGDRVLEIGPGRGALTAPLLASGCDLHVVEIDRDLAAQLQQRFGAQVNFHLHAGDALKLDLATLAGPEARAWRVVGNLPYNISTPLLFHLLAQRQAIADLHVMLQREVIERMTAPPGGRDYGRLTVMLAPYFEIERLFDIDPGAFAPPPQVWSAVARLRPRGTVTPAVDERYARVVAAAFAQRRKTLRNALRELVSAESMRIVGIDPGQRAEQLTPAQFATLAQACGKS
jgi:16S rRNA (adenine1518-N6/adenine1519-N6)-dimethyltransferase